jgi:hypothetical protein
MRLLVLVKAKSLLLLTICLSFGVFSPFAKAKTPSIAVPSPANTPLELSLLAPNVALKNGVVTASNISQKQLTIPSIWWADAWVSPTKSRSNQLLTQKWIDFCWQKSSQKQISILSKSLSPIEVKIDSTDIQERLRSLLLVEAETFTQSEFLLPLPQETKQQYTSLWQTLK